MAPGATHDLDAADEFPEPPRLRPRPEPRGAPPRSSPRTPRRPRPKNIRPASARSQRPPVQLLYH